MNRSTLIALVVLAALGGYIYWFEREPDTDAEGELVFDVEEDAVDRIEISTSEPEEKPVVVEKEGENHWRLTSPVATEADGTEVGLLTQTLATMRFERVVAKASEVKLTDFGLERPRIEVRFRTKDGSERSLAFGGDAPTTSNQYARRDGGEDILVVRSHLSLNFDKGGWDLREKRVFGDAGTGEPKRIEITRLAGNVLLAKEGGLWFVTEPRSRADRDRVAAIASRIREAEMREIVSETSENLEAYGLKDPSRRVRLEFEGEGASALELEIGSEKDVDYYARTPGREQVFLLAGDIVNDLESPLSELQSKKLFAYSVFEVSRFRVEAPGAEPRELEKIEAGDEKKWRRTRPEPAQELDTTAVEDLLYALNGASAARVLEGAGVAEPAYTITVWSGEPEDEEEIVVAPSGETVRATRAGEEVALELTPETWSEIEAKMTLEKKE
ncbi:MAG: DUF4340 domain-containing protein [Vicinamibacteria bacterium]